MEAIRYLDGELSELEMMRFEIKISEDAELTRLFECVSRLDRAQRVALKGRYVGAGD